MSMLLSAYVKQYTKDVKAFIRANNKQGFKYQPCTTIKVSLLLINQLKSLNKTLRSVYNIIQSKVGLLALCLRYAIKTHANYISQYRLVLINLIKVVEAIDNKVDKEVEEEVKEVKGSKDNNKDT